MTILNDQNFSWFKDMTFFITMKYFVIAKH